MSSKRQSKRNAFLSEHVEISSLPQQGYTRFFFYKKVSDASSTRLS